MTRKILIAVNETESSKFAFQWTLENIVKPDQDELTIFTVVEPPIQSGYYYAASGAIYVPSFIDEQYQKATDEAISCLRSYEHTLNAWFKDTPVKSEKIVGKGEVRDEIVDYAERNKMDLVVMGSRGMGTLKRTFIGSTSDYCIHHLTCPVIIVKNKQE